MTTSGYRAAGFSLVEALVSIVVLVIGLLGAAQMLLAAVRSSGEAAALAAAVDLARDLAEKMRMNGGVDPGAYVTDSREAPKAGTACGAAAACSAADLAQRELREWRLRVASALPDARFVVCFDDRPWNASADAYRWDCDARGTVPVVKLGWSPRVDANAQDTGGPPRLVMQLPAGGADGD